MQLIQLLSTVCSVPSPRGVLVSLAPKQSSKPPKLKHETL